MSKANPQAMGTAAVLFSRGQKVLLVVLAAALMGSIVTNALNVPLLISVVITLMYLVNAVMKFVLWGASVRYRLPEHYALSTPDAADLPTYLIQVPVVGEPIDVITRNVKALSELQYDKSKLEVEYLVEEWDTEMQEVFAQIELPSYMKMVLIPDFGPRTKPKACGYSLMHNSAERVVIYDAEDRPDPDQLLKAVAGMRAAQKKDSRIACLQAKLVFWNPQVSMVAMFYWAEYKVHYDFVLPGLAYLGLVPPLGGTSNHFDRKALDAVAAANGHFVLTRNKPKNEAVQTVGDTPGVIDKLEEDFEGDAGATIVVDSPWDPYNLTEDADLAARLAESNFRVDILNSNTYEEATSELGKARKQRSRWLQGYMHTAIVHLRHPVQKMRKMGFWSYLMFIMLMASTPISLILNPVTWATTGLYLAARLIPVPGITAYIEQLFPGWVFYAGIIAMLSNLPMVFQLMVIPSFEQERFEKQSSGDMHPLGRSMGSNLYGLTVRLLLSPLWWAFTSLSAYRAFRKLFFTVSERNSWDKTPHGSDMHLEDELMENNKSTSAAA